MHKFMTYAAAASGATIIAFVSPGGGSDKALAFRANPAIGQIYPSSQADADEAFEDYMAATLDMSEPDAGTWEEIKVKLGL
jgi:hypothetical protein